MGYPEALKKGEPAEPTRVTAFGLERTKAVAGVVVCGLPFATLGLVVLMRWWCEVGTPSWTLAFGFLFLGLGATAFSIIPSVFESRQESRRRRRHRHHLTALMVRVSLSLVLVNLPLAAYMAGINEMRMVKDWMVLWFILGANLVTVATAALTTPALRKLRAEAEVESLLAAHTATLTVAVRCPYCSTTVDPGEAVTCRSCETLHHRDCWEENQRCTLFGCGESLAHDLGGNLLD